ncbi:MAG: transcription repressor NadR [Clostridia bacterium]|nr:transcription repressor NadR [Clostridia bacterium]
MEANERREAVAALLRDNVAPISATALAQQFSVSRQLIVGDIALLRARGEDIAATPRGYLIPRDGGGVFKTLTCRHSGADLERELNLMVDQGCTVVDVAIEHPVYGLITGGLHLSSRYDVGEFIRKVREEDATPLSALTGGTHLHTLRCPDEAAFERVRRALDEAGFLAREP